MSKRAYISWKTKYAAALLALGDIEYEHAKGMTEDQIISLYNVDHGILHAIEPIDDFWNLTPKLIAEHREKSADDKTIISKSDRIMKANAAHGSAIQLKTSGRPVEEQPRSPRRMQSRPFQKKRKLLGRRPVWMQP